MKIETLSFIAAALIAGSAMAQDAAPRKAEFVDSKGKNNGTAELSTGAAGGVLMKLEISGLPAGQWVAFHVHETGTCDHTKGHESAGGHFNPGSKEHGFMSGKGPHAGDMPNQYVGADGVLRAEVFNPNVTLDKEKAGIVGRALMIHAKPDDHKGQPAGNAGPRLACAVIK